MNDRDILRFSKRNMVTSEDGKTFTFTRPEEYKAPE